MDEFMKEITKLTEEWYSLIAKDHHKDRDCHWYINTKWSYGNSPIYIVEHHGYVHNHVSVECKSYDEALILLKEELEHAIKQERSYEDSE
jgi:hypothetical protein